MPVIYFTIDRSPGAMWACVSPVSVGTTKTTGVTPSITCTGKAHIHCYRYFWSLNAQGTNL